MFINDDNTSTEYYSGANDCYIDMDLGEYNVAKISKIRFIPSISKHVLDYVGGKFQGKNITTGVWEDLYTIATYDIA